MSSFFLRLQITIVCFVFSLFTFQTAHALNVQSFHPKAAQTAGFQLYTSDMLQNNQVAFGFAINYNHHPLEIGQVVGNNRTRGLVEQFITMDFLASIGLADWFSLHIGMPINAYHHIAPVFIANADKGGLDFGDLRVSAQIRLLDPTRTSGWGLAIIPFASIPSGDSTIYFGDASATGGILVALDKSFGLNRFYINVGAKVRQREAIQNLVVNDEFLFGIGYNRPLDKEKTLDITAEINGSTTFNQFFNDEVSTPIEGHISVRKRFLKNKNLVAHLGGSYGITVGYGAPDFRVIAGVSYSFFIDKKPKKRNLFVLETIHFPFDSDRYYKKHNEFLDRVAKYTQNNPRKKMILRAHTDSKGDLDYNVKLSMRRANRVIKALEKRGISRKMIQVEVLGETEPAATNETDKGRHNNRRVEILFEK